MSARIVLNAISGSSRLLAKTFLSLRRGRAQVKKASGLFKERLIASGVPKKHATEIAEAYASAGLQFLKLRSLLSMARNLQE